MKQLTPFNLPIVAPQAQRDGPAALALTSPLCYSQLSLEDGPAMTATPMQMLARYGPDRCQSMTAAQARQWCGELASAHYENFSVLSWLVPAELREDFAAVYAFCRWADDLGDEAGDRDQASSLLAWWREELRGAFAGSPRHPVFIALQQTIERFDLPITPFETLIQAFEVDQVTTRYETWDQLLGYCRLSANPVGQLVLMLFREPRTDALFHSSDCICTALQLTNHLQDVRRDIVDRDRIYLPREFFKDATFEQRLVESARQGWGVDQRILEESRFVIRTCVERTWELFAQGVPLFDQMSPRSRPVVELLASGGCHVLRQIERWNYETALHRPRLGNITRALLVAKAWWRHRVASTSQRRGSS